MTIPIARTVTARDTNGKVLRTAECRSVETAVALETKLVGNRDFATWLTSEAGPASWETMPNGRPFLQQTRHDLDRLQGPRHRNL